MPRNVQYSCLKQVPPYISYIVPGGEVPGLVVVCLIGWKLRKGEVCCCYNDEDVVYEMISLARPVLINMEKTR